MSNILTIFKLFLCSLNENHNDYSSHIKDQNGRTDSKHESIESEDYNKDQEKHEKRKDQEDQEDQEEQDGDIKDQQNQDPIPKIKKQGHVGFFFGIPGEVGIPDKKKYNKSQ